MPEQNNNIDPAIQKDNDYIGKKAKAVIKPEITTNLDTNLVDIIAEQSGTSSQVDMTKINNFTQVSTRRDEVYNLIDQMAEDPTVAAILETYAEDATEYNDAGQIVWVQSDRSEVSKYISWLIDMLQIDKNIYKWVYSLCKYGDLYLQLYKESEYNNDLFFTHNTKTLKDKLNALNEGKENKKQLNEDVLVRTYAQNDRYVTYIENIANPAQMFELTRFGKTSGYIKADIKSSLNYNKDLSSTGLFTQYQFKQSDVTIYDNDKFVHATLDDNQSRVPEEVELFTDNNNENIKTDSTLYRVKRGQSLLYSVFKIWRELSLLENSILLNRITKSAIVRLINVEVGDMDKTMVGPHLQGIKSMMEQKSAITAGQSLNEYTNPGPIENNIYVPTYNGKGAITADQIGGDVNVGQLPDVDYFQNKFFGAMRVPKQYFGLTDDGAGFNGGQSLAIISSRYAKMIKRIQNSILQALTDVINLMLIDKGLDSYVNQFTLHMQPPTTQEEIDRRENVASKVQIVNDIMNLLSDIEDPIIKTKILKNLISTVITDDEVISLIDEQINTLEGEEAEAKLPSETSSESDEDIFGGLSDESSSSEPLNLDAQLGLSNEFETGEESTEESEENTLPTPEELGVDMTQNAPSSEEI